MLGIFLIICLAVFLLIKLKTYSLLNDYYEGPVEIDSDERTFQVCHRAMVLQAVSKMVILVGYVGCAWPYLFIEGIDGLTYWLEIVMFGSAPVFAIGYFCYLDFRNSRGYIRISTQKIEYQRRKHFVINISDIKKISDPGVGTYQIHLKEKGKKSLSIALNGFYRKDELCSLMKELRDRSARASGRDKSLVYRLGLWKLGRILTKCYLPLSTAAMGLMLFYSSYCCIDYDFFKRDYTALFNTLGADPNQTENAWEHYVHAAVNYTELEYEFQETIKKCLDSGEFDLSDDQKADLRKWFGDNASSWASLKKAASVAYCNSTYENISLVNSTGRDDFSSPSDTGYGQIRHLYDNANAGSLAGVLNLDWFDLFQMQLASSKHFINGKSFIDQLAGYGLLAQSIKLIAAQDSYELEDLQKVRNALDEHFPGGLPSLRMEGEILIVCSFYDYMINLHKIPIQSPLNPTFHMLGSRTGTEGSVRTCYTAALEKAHKGIEVEPREFSIWHFPLIRSILFGLFDGSIAGVYKVSQRADTNLLAAYFLLDLEEYQLIKGCYPVDVPQLREAGLTSQLPDDPHTDDKIIYRNDGHRAILYAAGPNAKDDNGYDDDKGSDKKRDDRIYWQRNLREGIAD